MSTNAPAAVYPDAALIVAELLWSGQLQSASYGADGTWTVVPSSGGTRRLTGTEQVRAYAARANGTGPAALALAEADARTGAADHAGLRASYGG